MRDTRAGRFACFFVAGVVAAASVGAVIDTAIAKPKAKISARNAKVVRTETPLGLQGTRGAGINVVVPFTLVDPTRRRTNVELEFGWDVNGDGLISDGTGELPVEYFKASEDRRDSRNTRRNRRPQTFTTAGGIGASHAWVWSSATDVAAGRFETLAYLYTPQGRRIPDPDNPGSFLFAPIQPGVKVRVRSQRGKKRRSKVSEWSYSDQFSLNNNTRPVVVIDEVVENAPGTGESDENVQIRWTAFDEDSEDLNGNGNLDAGEDANNDGVLGTELVAVAFDYYRVPVGVDPTSMSQAELDALLWKPCTRADQDDTDEGVPSAPGGIQYTYAWDSVTDVGTVHAPFILRARPFNVAPKNEQGEWVYFNTPFTLDNWKIFSPAGPDSSLASGRVGMTVTNLTADLDRSDPLYTPPFQQFLVIGGAVDELGNGSTNSVDAMLVDTETSETSTATRAPFGAAQMQDNRSFHTATMLDDGRVLIAGGFDENGTPLKSTEIYDPFTRTTTPGPALITARAKHAAVRLTSGDVAIFGGVGGTGTALDSCEIYRATPESDPVAPTTDALPSMATAQHSLHAVLLPDQRVLVTGGIDDAGNAVTSAEALNPLNDDDASDPTTKDPVFEAVGSMMVARAHGTATRLHEGHVLFMGGAGSAALTSMELYNFETEVFERASLKEFSYFGVDGEVIDLDLPIVPRAQHLAVLMGDGAVLLAGGVSDTTTNAIVAAGDTFKLDRFENHFKPGPTETEADDPDPSDDEWVFYALPVNGDMRWPRRMAGVTAVNNGRFFIAGGYDAAGAPLAELEVFTPEAGTNGRPSAEVVLQSELQSWAFGAPILYRVFDPEGDLVNVVVQWSNDGKTTWNAALPQPDTIAGDQGELTAGLTTTNQLILDKDLAIDPVGQATPGDHKYIWSMKVDIPRPAPGGQDGPYNLRVIPMGAVQGIEGESKPVFVLFNTKVVATILPFETPHFPDQYLQGGDIEVITHLRDIDGSGPVSNGDPVDGLFEYAIDANNDGQISDKDGEFWQKMTPAQYVVDNPAGSPGFDTRNEVLGLQSWSLAPDDPLSEPGTRPANKGWYTFTWDSVYDLGAPATTFRNVWVRLTPFDDDEGILAVARNFDPIDDPAIPDNLVIVPHPDALWLSGFSAADANGDPGGDLGSVSVNQPLIFEFNGMVDLNSLDRSTIRIFKGATEILGIFRTKYDSGGGSTTTTITFYPLVQSTTLDTPDYDEGDADTVLYGPGREYRVQIAGYTPGSDPVTNAATTLRPENASYPAIKSTYLLVQNVPVDGDLNSAHRFTTDDEHYDDGLAAPTDTDQDIPVSGSTLGTATEPLSFFVTQGIDVATAISPNLTVLVDGNVVPGQWSVKNVQQADGTHSSLLTFNPLTQFPSGQTVDVAGVQGLKLLSGRDMVFAKSYTAAAIGRTNTSIVESFDDEDMKDTNVTTAIWGTDPCFPGAILGLQDASTPPQGGSDLVVSAGQTIDITGQVSDYDSITVAKGGVLRIRSTTGAATVRVTGDVDIAGVIDFKGSDGYIGHTGNTSGSVYYYYSSTARGTRVSPPAFNGAGKGGQSHNATSNSGRTAGTKGTGPAPGAGGNTHTTSTYYGYGGGGGAGAGHGTSGLAGGRASSISSSSSYGAASTPGGVTGSREFTNGPSVGSGGGGGGSHRFSSSYFHQGGGGASGAGAVTFFVAGKFNLEPTGYIDGRGGAGGSSAHYSGSGGGGSGGGLHVKAGGGAFLDGVIDLRGGRGGPLGGGTYSDYYMHRYTERYGNTRHGGDGGLGRCVVEAANFGVADEVRIYGQMIVQQINSIPTSTIQTASLPDSRFTTGSTSIDFGNTSEVRYTNLSVPAGRTVDLDGNSSLKIFVDGDIDIAGTLNISGEQAPKTGGAYGNQNEPNGMNFGYEYFGTIQTTLKGSAGTLGGGAGGDPHGANPKKQGGKKGSGPQGGDVAIDASNTGYSWSGWYQYFSGDSGGGGAGNATSGEEGWAPYSFNARYAYQGATHDTTGNGLLPGDREGGKPGGANDFGSFGLSDFDDYVGSGAGAGNIGGVDYQYSGPWQYYGHAGISGGGAGALALIGADNSTLTLSGSIIANGGDGNRPGGAGYRYSHSGGGAGSGGTVALIGDSVNITPAASETGTGATIELFGGTGGGWRAYRYRWTTYTLQFPAYNSAGAFGGDGGFGAAVIQYKSSLNNGSTLVNRWGMEQQTFRDDFKQYQALAGSFFAGCYGAPGGNVAQSKWYDFGSVRPVLNSIARTTMDMNATVQVEGAQSDPHDIGPYFTNANADGVPDENNTTGRFTFTSAHTGERWWRFYMTFSRQGSGIPTMSDFTWNFETDN